MKVLFLYMVLCVSSIGFGMNEADDRQHNELIGLVLHDEQQEGMSQKIRRFVAHAPRASLFGWSSGILFSFVTSALLYQILFS